MKNIPSVPRDMPFHHQEFLTAVKDVVETLAPPSVPPGRPTNLNAHPMPGGVQITFTGGDSADSHLLLVSDQARWDPSKANNHIIDLGASTLHVHQVGQPGVTRYYWIVAKRGNAKSSPPSGPVSATTLALNVAAGNPTFVPLSPTMVKSVQTGRPTVLKPRKGGMRDLL